MAAHGRPTDANEEASQENREQAPPTHEDTLADKLQEGGFSGEQQTAIQATLALLFGASTHAIEIKQSLDLLRGEIDVNRLVTDPKYKAQVERAVQLTNRYGRLVKKGDLIEKVPKIEKVIERTNACHSKLLSEKSAMLANDNLYLRRLQSAYNLDDSQLQAISYSAWAKIRENPSLSIKDALRIEAENFSLKQVMQEVEKENRGKKLTKDERKALVEKKLTEKHVAFETSLTTTDAKTGQKKSYADYEQRRIDAIIKAQIEENKRILTTVTQPVATPTPQPTTIAPSPPTPPPPLVSPAPISPPGFSLPSFSLPSGLTQGLGNMFGGLGKMFGGIGKGMGSLFGKNGMLSKGFDLATRLGKQLLNRGIDAFLPGAGAVIGKINDVIKSILGIDVEGLILKGAVVLVVAVVVIIVVVPIIIGISVFSYITGSNPVQVSMTNDKTVSWNEFNKQYLTINTENQLSWQQFEKGSLSPQKQYLSLDPNRHDDVKK